MRRLIHSGWNCRDGSNCGCMVNVEIRRVESGEQDRNQSVGFDITARHREDHSGGNLGRVLTSTFRPGLSASTSAEGRGTGVGRLHASNYLWRLARRKHSVDRLFGVHPADLP